MQLGLCQASLFLLVVFFVLHYGPLQLIDCNHRLIKLCDVYYDVISK